MPTGKEKQGDNEKVPYRLKSAPQQAADRTLIVNKVTPVNPVPLISVVRPSKQDRIMRQRG
jgi:hypothetical protein